MTMIALDIDRDTDALQEILRRIGARDDVRQWPRGMSLRRAWTGCKRGDRLLWLAALLGVDRELVTLASCRSARLALVHVPEVEGRPRHTIETAEAWCRGEATIEHVRSAAEAARAAAYAAEAARADHAAHAAYAAARTAYADGYAYAHVAADAAAHAARAAAHAAYAADAGANTLRQCADLVRETIPYHAIAAAARRVLKENK